MMGCLKIQIEVSRIIKLLLGGSPCTHWSIAQKNSRETEPSGLGWELFKNYLIAKEKYKPDYFLYENNKSAAQPIKDQIAKELRVDLQYINSALVSAQNRRRFYAHNIPNVLLPPDRGILLKDILENAITWQEKSYALTTSCKNAIPEDTIKKHRHTMVACPIGTRVVDKSRTLTASYSHHARRDFEMDIITNGQLGSTNGSWIHNNFFIELSDENFKNKTIYEVKDSLIKIKDIEYPIKLPDGHYMIRKLSVTECKRLQTVPDEYIMPCSNSQNYKMLGNGWTVEN